VHTLNISLMQGDLAWQRPAENRAYFESLIRGTQTPTDLIILPEMFSTGFTMDARRNAETMDGASVAWMVEMAHSTQIAICGSLIIEEEGHFFNRLIWAAPDTAPAHYDKRHLFRMAGEHNHYSAGTRRKIFTLGNWRICPMICYDLRFPVWTRGNNELDLLLFVANWPAPRRSAWQMLLPARAIENQCYVAAVNRTGTDGNSIAYCGDSTVIDYLGHALGTAGDTPSVLRATLDRRKLQQYREKFPAYLDADEFDLRS